MKLKIKASYQKWDLTQLKYDIKKCKFKVNEDFDIKKLHFPPIQMYLRLTSQK
jgi:hypothetical protein